MGLGDIVAFALGGYVFLAKFLVTRDSMARLSGYDMLFACGVAGIVLAGVTMPLAMYLRAQSGYWWPGTIGAQTVAAGLGIPVSFVLASLLNKVSRIKKWRLNRLRTLAESNSDLIEVLLDDAIRGNCFVELALQNGKSYVGMPTRTVYAASSEGADVEVIPLFSGYRSSKRHELRLTRYYGNDILALVNSPIAGRPALLPRDFRVVIPLREVVTARLFDPDVFEHFNPGGTLESVG